VHDACVAQEDISGHRQLALLDIAVSRRRHARAHLVSSVTRMSELLGRLASTQTSTFPRRFACREGRIAQQGAWSRSPGRAPRTSARLKRSLMEPDALWSADIAFGAPKRELRNHRSYRRPFSKRLPPSCDPAVRRCIRKSDL